MIQRQQAETMHCPAHIFLAAQQPPDQSQCRQNRYVWAVASLGEE
jgi:hypothetical protein